MAQRVDCHAHSWFSFDARASIDEMCRGALEHGVKVLTLTEHYDFGEPPVQEHYACRAARRMAEMREARARWAGKVELLCGIELGQPAWGPQPSCGKMILTWSSAVSTPSRPQTIFTTTAPLTPWRNATRSMTAGFRRPTGWCAGGILTPSATLTTPSA